MDHKAGRQISMKEICGILKVASKCGVSELSFGSFNVRFAEKAPRQVAPEPLSPSPEEILQEESQPGTASTKEVPVHDEVEVRDEQMALALIEDPSLWAKLSEIGDDADEDPPRSE